MGERAFDRCLRGLLIWAIGVILSLIIMAFVARLFSWQTASLIPMVWSIAMLPGILWCLVAIVRIWKDPSARVLRLSSLGLLLLLCVANVAFAFSPALLSSSDEKPADTESGN